jgi:uncharacterized protein (DUF58 family)
METLDLIKKVRKIEIKTRRLSKHLFAGEYHSAFKGKGMTFSEVREYQYGDSIRDIDWNVTARFNHPFVKIFEEERELTMMLLVDVSASKLFGTSSQLKQELMTELAAVISFSAIQNNDKIGVIFFSSKIEKFIPPKKGKTHALRIIRELLEFQPEEKGTNLSEALRYLTNVIRKRCTAFVISDFMDASFHDALSITAKKHDVIALKVYDQREKEIPSIGLIRMKDAETAQEKWIDTSSRMVREQYKKWWMDQDRYHRDSFRKSGVDSVYLATGEDYVKPLIQLFKKRE